MAVRAYTVKVSTTGSAGSATGSAMLALPLCELLALHLDYHASAPATTDVTVSSPGNPESQTIMTRTDSKTDGWFYPRRDKDDTAGAALTADHAEFVVHGNLLVSVAQCDALTDAVTATVFVRE